MYNQEYLLPQGVESFIAAMDAAHTLVEIFDVLSTNLTHIGFDYFAYWLLRPPGDARKPLCISNYPDDWAWRYLRENYKGHDYVGRSAGKSAPPLSWSMILEKNKLAPQQKFSLRSARATFSVSNQMKQSEFAKLFDRHEHDIHLMAAYTHEKIISLNLHRPVDAAMRLNLYKPLDATIRLTPREIEVLTWAAKGKSRWEASVILGICEDTVKTHLENIRNKLGATNTTHAIAIALMNGLLLP